MTTYNGISTSTALGISSSSTISGSDASQFSTTASNSRAIYASATQQDAVAAASSASTHSGVWGSNSAGGTGVAGSVSGGSAGYGVYGISYNAAGVGVYAKNGTAGTGSFQPIALYADASGGGANACGIYIVSDHTGIYSNVSRSGSIGIHSVATSNNNSVSVQGEIIGPAASCTGILGVAPTGNSNYAGYFTGDVYVNGNLGKGTGTFIIDHPLDPENKYLTHSLVESPEMKNIYDGVATLDANGECVVKMPSYFDALNVDIRYQLTSIGVSAPGLFIKQKMNNGQFAIGGGNAGQEVSWQITGVRQDALAKARPIEVEREKETENKGLYLTPEAHGQPKERGISYNRHKNQGVK